MFCKIAAGNVRRRAKDYFLYFLTLVLGIAVFYAFNSIADQQAVAGVLGGAGSLIDLLGMVISGVSVFVVVVLAFLVVYASRFLIKRRKQELAVYLTLGMQRGQVARLIAAETGLVGIVSLAVGVLLGFGLSQALMRTTASMFGSDVPGFALFFSAEAFAKTVGCFAAIFLATIVLDSGVVMHARLVDLMSASKAGEKGRIRSLPLSFLLFLVSCAMIAASYSLLLEAGIASFSPEFGLATALVCAGTLLFFFSLSGFLLRAVQSLKPLYLRGLSAFTLRQLDSRVNSTFLSMSVVSICLFLALTSVCGGIGICNTLQANLSTTTKFDATASTAWTAYGEGLEGSLWGRFAEQVGYDMEKGLAQSAEVLGYGPWEAMVEDAVQVDFLNSTTLTYGTLEELAGESLQQASGGMVTDGYADVALSYIPLSQYNAALRMAGEQPVLLDDGECALAGDFDMTSEWLGSIARSGGSLDVEGRQLEISDEVLGFCLETTSAAMQPGAIVVPDSAIPDGLSRYRSILNVDLVDSDSQVVDRFEAFMTAVRDDVEHDSWPLSTSLTREEVWEQSMGLTAIVAYLAVYIGFVLVIASAAILAIQQLSAASDNAGRYALLAKLGASDSQVRTSVIVQVAVCFAFPLALAVAHSACAFQVVADVVSIFGHLDIGAAAGGTAIGFVALYGLYFLLTCWGSVGLAKSAR